MENTLHWPYSQPHLCHFVCLHTANLTSFRKSVMLDSFHLSLCAFPGSAPFLQHRSQLRYRRLLEKSYLTTLSDVLPPLSLSDLTILLISYRIIIICQMCFHLFIFLAHALSPSHTVSLSLFLSLSLSLGPCHEPGILMTCYPRYRIQGQSERAYFSSFNATPGCFSADSC